MKVLLTGATGLLGNNLLRALLHDGHEVKVLVRHSSDRRPTDGLEVEKAYAELADSSQIGLAVEGVDLLIHAAAMIQLGWSRLEQSLKVNADATKVLAEAARRRSIRMIHVSSVDCLAAGTRDHPSDENCLNPAKSQCSYVVSKRKAEQVFLEQVGLGLDGVMVNPGFMIGPYDWKPSSGAMMTELAKQPLLFFAPGGGCSIVDVRDVAEGIISAVQHGRSGERYILGGHNMDYLELWTMMAKVMNRRPPKMALPNWMAVMAGRAGDLAGKFLKNEPQVNSAATAMAQLFNYYSSDKAKRDLGYKIGSVETALVDAWKWLKAYGYV